jgi:hypothetical protein
MNKGSSVSPESSTIRAVLRGLRPINLEQHVDPRNWWGETSNDMDLFEIAEVRVCSESSLHIQLTP